MELAPQSHTSYGEQENLVVYSDHATSPSITDANTSIASSMPVVGGETCVRGGEYCVCCESGGIADGESCVTVNTCVCVEDRL